MGLNKTQAFEKATCGISVAPPLTKKISAALCKHRMSGQPE